MKAKLRLLSIALLLLGVRLPSVRAWQSDNGDGTFTNPVLYADYPDPDITRVGRDFYMVSTTFADSAGITVLHSQDLVNWEIAGHAASTLDGGDASNLVGGANMYRGGLWAPSIRYWNGTFYVAVQPTFANGRIYYATNPAGPWNFYQLDRGIYDPGLFIDTDGTGYIVCGHGPQNVMKLNATFSAVVSETDNVVNSGGEGSHLIKRGSYYYLFNANPGVWPYQLLCSRATSLYGPWETGHVCLTETTGGHQGGVVDLNANDDWCGFVAQDSGAIGRMTRLGPVYWSNNWPVFGTTAAPNLMAASYPKPILGKALLQPGTSDDFSAATLGLQWQWNHNPDNTKWSLTERPGFLRLRPTPATGLWTARNTLTQKGQGPLSSGVVKLDLTNLQPGDNVGFGALGKVNGRIYVTADASGNRTLGMEVDNRGVGAYTAASGVAFTGNTLYLRADLNFQNNLGVCAYGADGTNWTKLGGDFPLDFDITYGTFQGEKFAISCLNASPGSGYVDVDAFTFSTTASLVSTQRGRPQVNAVGTTFVADDGQPLRGPYTSTEWTTATTESQLAAIKNLGCNAVHLYAETFDPHYPASGSTAPGYAVAQVDSLVQSTRDLGLYLIITIGNGSYNGLFNRQYVLDFWNLYAARYKDQTHVIFEVQNEPFAWGPSYDDVTLQMEADAYVAIRAQASNTPILLFSYSVLASGSLAVNDINTVKAKVLASTGTAIDWTKTGVAFHGYAGGQLVAASLGTILSAGYPCFMTEFIAPEWGGTPLGADIELTSELERLRVSWLAFLYVPPSGVSADVTVAANFKDRMDRAGLSWVPDAGYWPVARGPYNHGGQPRQTTSTWTNSILTGTLRIEAEDFDSGGQGIAYADTDATNGGGAYRPGETVEVDVTGDTGGGYDVAWTNAGDWAEYTLWVEEPGFYNVALRAASAGGGSVGLTFNGADKTGTWTLPATGGAQTWATQTRQVFLESGRQKLRVNMLAGAFALNWIELTPTAAGPLADGTYKLVNRNSGQVMAADTTTGTVVQNAWSSTTTQQWTLQNLGAGQYKITSAANGNSWNVAAGSGNGVGVVGWWSSASNWQRFVIRPSNNGYYRFESAALGYDLDVAGASLANGAEIVQDTFGGAASQQWAVQAATAPGIPTALNAAYVPATGVILNWASISGASGYNVKRATVSGGPYTVLASGVTSASYTDASVLPGTAYYYVVTAVVGGVESLPSGEISVFPPWKWQDIGAVGAAGNTACTGGVYTVNGSGADIWNAADACHFAYMPLSGDGAITARVTGVQNTDPWAKAGVMIRESLAAGAANAFIALTPGNGVNWQYRAATGGNGVNTTTAGLAAPYWVRLVRSGNIFTSYSSLDGAAWTQRGTVSIPMASAVYMGLAVTSHNNGVLCAATFDSVTTTPDWLASVVPASPSAPSGLTAVVSNASAGLTWNAVAGAASYRVKRAAVSGGPYAVLAGVGATAYTDAGLANGTAYFYVVSALNSAGESANSAEATATPSTAANFSPVSASAQDGYVTGASGNATGGSSNATSTTLLTGDSSANRQYKAILSFDTSSIPAGAAVQSATLQMKRVSLSGTNPFTILGNCTVDLKRGAFNGNAALENSDFQAAADATTVAVMSDPGANGNWSTGTLNATGRALLNRGGVTQFRVAFTTATNSNAVGDYLSWYSGNTTTSGTQPVLAVSYSLSATFGAPLVWLKLDETGGTVASDSSGKGWNATLVNGPTWTTGHIGNAVSLDGTDDHLTLPTGVAAGLGDFTVAVWVKLNALSSWARLFDFGTGTSNYMFLTTDNASGVPRFAVRTPTIGEQVIDGSAALPVGVWTHVAVTMAGSTGTLYVNGTVVGTNTAMTLAPAALGNTAANYIGRSEFNDSYLNGQVDDFRIYPTALAAQDVAALVSPPGQPSGLAATGGNGKVVLVWNAVSGATGYSVARSVNAAGPYTVILTGYTGTTFTDFDVGNGTTYYYVVTAVNGVSASVPSAQANATPQAPPQAPGNLAATVGDAKVSLSWSASAGASSYTIQRTAASDGTYKTVANGLTAMAYIDSGLVNDTTYYYTVTAVNNGGSSAASPAVSARPAAPISAQEMLGLRLDLTPAGADMTLQTVAGHTYQLQYCDDLASGAWQNYGTPQVGVGSSLLLNVPMSPLVPKRFFRVVIQP